VLIAAPGGRRKIASKTSCSTTATSLRCSTTCADSRRHRQTVPGGAPSELQPLSAGRGPRPTDWLRPGARFGESFRLNRDLVQVGGDRGAGPRGEGMPSV